MDSGTATAPIRLALAIDGCAPVSRAARSHRSQARDPVTNRFGPRFSPISNAKGWPGGQAASNDAAGKLLTSTELAAATTAVPRRSRWDRSTAGPDQSRPSVPSATATPNKPARVGTPTTPATLLTWVLQVASRSPATAAPIVATGRAGDGRA